MILIGNLTDSLQILKQAVNKNATMSILKNVRVYQFNKSRHPAVFCGRRAMRMTTSDLEMQIEVIVPIIDKKIGDDTYCINHEKLLMFSEANKGFDIKISRLISDNCPNIVELSSKSKSKLNIIKISDYPLMDINISESTTKLIVPADEFADAVKDIEHCCDDKHIDFALHGVNFLLKKEGKANELVMTCADGARLARKTIILDNIPNTRFGINCIIPIKTMKALSTIFASSKESENITLMMNENNFSTTNRIVTVKGRNVDAKFPDFSRVINNQEYHKVIVDVGLLSSNIETVMPTVDGIKKTIQFTFSKDNVHMSTINDMGEESNVDTQCQYNNDPIFSDDGKITIGLNVDYVLQALKRYKTIVSIGIDNSMKNITITSANQEEENNTFNLIMAVQI